MNPALHLYNCLDLNKKEQDDLALRSAGES
jgi:hypothetical protein